VEGAREKIDYARDRRIEANNRQHTHRRSQMLLRVLLFNLISAVPKLIGTLFESVGYSDDAISKLSKLREVKVEAPF
jgi:hypothetical protein